MKITIRIISDEPVTLEEALAWLERQGKQDARYKYLEELLEADTIYQMAMNDAMVEEAKTKAIEAISNMDIFKLLGLEKQSEQKPADKAKVEHLIPQKGMYYTCIKDYYSSDNTHLCVKGNIYKSFFNGYIDDESHLGLSWTNSCTEKYFEPTKDEDWIVCEHDNVIGKPMQYKEFKKKVNQKFIENLKAQGLTPKLRLWNLKDAKGGDVLYAKGSYFKEYIFMFSSFTEDNVISTHFGYDAFHGTFDKKLTRFGREEDFISVTPATKEQRDLLFQKMKEAGYEWNAEKKELKKIEQKPIGWSEEDELSLKQAIYVCHQNGYTAVENWLKSIRPQKQWKPSDEQMEALDDFIYAKYPNTEKYGAAVKSLYQDLKKLREE